MESTEVIIAIIGIVGSVAGILVTHILERRKFKAEVAKLSVETQGDTISNIDKSLDFYEKWVEKTNNRLDEVLKNQDKLISENIFLKEELNTVKEQTTKMSALLCTDLPCTKRIQDDSVINCIYKASNIKKAKKRKSTDTDSE